MMRTQSFVGYEKPIRTWQIKLLTERALLRAYQQRSKIVHSLKESRAITRIRVNEMQKAPNHRCERSVVTAKFAPVAKNGRHRNKRWTAASRTSSSSIRSFKRQKASSFGEKSPSYNTDARARNHLLVFSIRRSINLST